MIAQRYEQAEKLLETQSDGERARWHQHVMCRLFAKRGLMVYYFNIVEARWLTELIAKS